MDVDICNVVMYFFNYLLGECLLGLVEIRLF